MANPTSHHPLAPTTSVQRGWATRRTVVACGGAAAAGAALLLSRESWMPWLPASWQPTIAWSERDVLLVADFDNLTGDEAFDGCLDAALTVALMQSRVLSVYPRHRLAAALARVPKPDDAVVDLELACNLALREGLRLVVAGRIEKAGSGLRLSLQLVDPSNRQALWHQAQRAASRDQVLGAIDALALRLRRRLRDEPDRAADGQLTLGQATTASWPALKLYARNLRLKPEHVARGNDWLRQALVLDPDFALALSTLAWQLYLSSDHVNRAEGDRLFARAQALPHRLTQRDRLWLVPLADDARGKREEAVSGYRAFLARYPADRTALFRLGWTYMAGLGKTEAAAEVFARLTQIDPRDASAWINLATCLGSMRQDPQALAAYRHAFALRPEMETAIYVNGEYGATLVRLGRLDEARAMFAKMQALPDSMRQARGHRSMAYLFMHQGRYRDALAELGRAIELNHAAGQTLGEFRDHGQRALVHLALGAADAARRDLGAMDGWIARNSPEPYWLLLVVKLRARLGDAAQARRLVSMIGAALGNTRSDSGIERNLSRDHGYLDLARAEVALLEGQAGLAVSLATRAAERLKEDLTWATWARALHRAGRTDDAAAKYQALIDKAPFGLEAQEELAPALVALATIKERAGAPAQARGLYERLALQWREGDAELPLLKQVRASLNLP